MGKKEQKKAQQPGSERLANETELEPEALAENSGVASQNIEQIKRALLDPRLISKKIDAVGRDSIKTEICKIRIRAATIGEKLVKIMEALEQKKQRIADLKALRVEKNIELRPQLETLGGRFKKFFRIKDKSVRKLESEIEEIETEIDELSDQTSKLSAELESLTQEQVNLPEPKQMLDEYYAQIETLPMSNEEKRELLRPELLAELSTEEYIALWRRLNPYFLSHVTRQGFRDHNATIYHTAGLKDFHEGLVSILQDQKLLRPPIAVRDGLLARDEESIREYLEARVLQAEDEKEAKEILRDEMDFSIASAPNYPDITAVHFAAQIVADSYYGGEKGNEVFFVYPADVLASQYYFAFSISGNFTEPKSKTLCNDVFVWPSELDNPGIPIDAGVVFLPASTPVDPQTGSKYASEVKNVDGEQKRVTKEDEKLVSAFVEWAENLTDQSPAIRALYKYREFRERVHFRGGIEQKNCYEVFKNEIMKLGFCEEAALDITHRLFADSLGVYHAYPTYGQLRYADSKKEAAIKILRTENANWKRAEHTISSKEYWEAYFEQHPDQKPNHLVFYNGEPTAAIHEFQKKYDIGQADTSKQEGDLLGFDDHLISDMKKDPRANRGHDELAATAIKIIEEHYRGKE